MGFPNDTWRAAGNTVVGYDDSESELRIKWRAIVSATDSTVSYEECRDVAHLMQAAPKLLKACRKAESLLDALLSFYGQGLEVANWHQNGDTEPLDNFIDENSDGTELQLLRDAIAEATGLLRMSKQKASCIAVQFAKIRDSERPEIDNPQWDMANMVHDWRNHVPEWLQVGWGDLSEDARMLAAILAFEAAMNEEWD